MVSAMTQDEYRKKIGIVLKTERLKRDLSQENAVEYFSPLIDIECRTWQRYENGITSIPSDKLLLIMEKWDIQFSQIIEAELNANPKRASRKSNVHKGSTYGPKDERQNF